MSFVSPPPHSENISLEMNNSVTLENENMVFPLLQLTLLVAIGIPSGELLTRIILSLPISVKLEAFSTAKTLQSPWTPVAETTVLSVSVANSRINFYS